MAGGGVATKGKIQLKGVIEETDFSAKDVIVAFGFTRPQKYVERPS